MAEPWDQPLQGWLCCHRDESGSRAPAGVSWTLTLFRLGVREGYCQPILRLTLVILSLLCFIRNPIRIHL